MWPFSPQKQGVPEKGIPEKAKRNGQVVMFDGEPWTAPLEMEISTKRQALDRFRALLSPTRMGETVKEQVAEVLIDWIEMMSTDPLQEGIKRFAELESMVHVFRCPYCGRLHRSVKHDLQFAQKLGQMSDMAEREYQRILWEPCYEVPWSDKFKRA